MLDTLRKATIDVDYYISKMLCVGDEVELYPNGLVRVFISDINKDLFECRFNFEKNKSDDIINNFIDPDLKAVYNVVGQIN